MSSFTVATPSGPARVDLDVSKAASVLLVLGHGAGGSVDAADLASIRDACLAADIGVARVTQPYRVAGRKAPPPAARLDEAWAAVIGALGRRAATRHLTFVYGGRSSGARVACRAAADPALQPAAQAVVAIAFPVHPPGKPERSRLAELDHVPVPVLVVQGRQDPFGQPPRRRGRTMVVLDGDHGLSRSAAQVGPAVAAWLARTLPAPG
ncbi:MAG TPA: alpha/beta family hydrolase [Jatrophihabitans sp.]|nr:alpha/beta family hydrolase [Jatrophihabitans sp.]